MDLKRLSCFKIVRVLIGLLILNGLTAATALGAGVISIDALPYSQNFDTLATSGITNNIILNGWYINEEGVSARNDELYAAGSGTDNTGDTYSFGSSGSTERAFGMLLSGSLTPTIGATFINNTGATIVGFDISYIGEQWRLGVTNRGSSDRMDFQYSTDATSLTTGTWTNWNTLDFSSPVTLGTAGALDGNIAANRTLLSSSITSLSIAQGSSFWIRWMDFDLPSSDDGLAVDDFSLTPTVSNPVPEPATMLLLGFGLMGLACIRRR